MSAYTAGQRDYCAAQQSVDALLPSDTRSGQFTGMRNWLIFALIGTTALLAAAIDDAVATQKRSHAY